MKTHIIKLVGNFYLENNKDFTTEISEAQKMSKFQAEQKKKLLCQMDFKSNQVEIINICQHDKENILYEDEFGIRCNCGMQVNYSEI